jgi:hypothetical protein
VTSKKLKHEADLLREALRVGTIYAEKRRAAEFSPSDSQDEKIEFLYKLLVHDQLIQPLAKEDISLPNMKHKLALWISRQLPADHKLLQ